MELRLNFYRFKNKSLNLLIMLLSEYEHILKEIKYKKMKIRRFFKYIKKNFGVLFVYNICEWITRSWRSAHYIAVIFKRPQRDTKIDHWLNAWSILLFLNRYFDLRSVRGSSHKKCGQFYASFLKRNIIYDYFSLMFCFYFFLIKKFFVAAYLFWQIFNIFDWIVSGKRR